MSVVTVSRVSYRLSSYRVNTKAVETSPHFLRLRASQSFRDGRIRTNSFYSYVWPKTAS
jgi:hypothetical protein